MKMDDRATQGFISGFLGGIPQMVFTLTMYSLHLAKFRYMDFAATIAYNHRPIGLVQSILTELMVLLFVAFLGVIFSLVVKHISSENLIPKATLFGIYIWFFIYAVVTAYKIRPLESIDFPTSIIHMVGGLIWGFFMGLTYKFLTRKYGLKN